MSIYNIFTTQKTVTTNGVTTTTNYYYDNGKLVEEKQGSKRIDYLYDENGSIYTFKLNGNIYYYVKDALQNIHGILNPSGGLAVKYTYDAYGNIISTTGTLADKVGAANPIRYKGYYYDTDTGYY